MAPEPDLAAEAMTILSRQFDAAEDATHMLQPNRMTMEDVRRFVADRVRILLHDNPALLMSILYRVDVAERDVRAVLDYSEPSHIPLDIADLLIERQIQKISVRRAYQQPGGEA